MRFFGFGRKKAKSPPCVVVADDVSTIRAIVRNVSEKAGYKTFEARNAAEAVEMTRKQAPMLVVLDLDMGGTDGLDALREIRSDDKMGAVPVVILSGTDDPEVISRVTEAGATDYVIKRDLGAVTSRLRDHLAALSA